MPSPETIILRLLSEATSLPLAVKIGACVLAAVIIIAPLLRNKKFIFRRMASHHLKHLTTIETPQEKFYYLRSRNPFVFEEMILTAIQKKGHKIRRNKRYTGDGGIDGRAWINDQFYLIQAKRYRLHINPAHVQAFGDVCRAHRAHGLFIHTGKTGVKSKFLHTADTTQHMISGTAMLNLLDLNNHDPIIPNQ